MNTKEYISSGIIESYVLGLASEQERKEFEQVCLKYPEIAAARDAFERSVEELSAKDAIQPPVFLKEKVIAGINKNILNQVPEEGTSKAVVRNLNWLKYAVAACLVLLAGSIYWNYSLYNKTKELSADYESMNAKLRDSILMINEFRSQATLLTKPGMKMAALHGTAHSPESFVTIYWDTTSKDVYMMVNNLPRPASEKQYQLWAIIEGQDPIDMGMLEINEKPLQLYKMKNVQHAQAFAITLERKGGSAVPTIDSMYVQGKL